MKVFHEISVTDLHDNVFTEIGERWMLISAEKDGVTNTMTASWGGFGILWNQPVAYIFVRPQRHTKVFLEAASHFSLTFFDETQRKQLSYLGTVSGKDTDKIKDVGYHVCHEEAAPYFEEAQRVLICQKLYHQDLSPDGFLDAECKKHYPQNDYHPLYVGKIVKVLEKDT